MRFSVLSALCMAPLALAGTLQADIHARRSTGQEAGLVLRTEGKDSSSKENSKDVSKGGSSPGKVIIEQSSTTQVIIIWYNQGGNAATTTVTETTTVTGAAGAPAAAAATHSVIVGGAGGLVYTPSEIVAAPGDMVIFEFQSQNHTATQSSFDTPCKKLEGGMDTGFMANPNNTVSPAPQMAMQVVDTKPIWFYCKQKTHCGKGMVFSINPTAEKTHAMFQNMAIAQNGTGATAPIAGGAAAPAAPAATTLSTAAPPAATAAPPAAAAPAAPAAGGTGMVAGSGTVQGGACACSCLCGVAAFPQAAQGIASFGGMSGAMPMSALEA